MIDERGNDWRRDPPDGTEVYVWFMDDENATDEPEILYIGLGDRTRSVWYSAKNEAPRSIESLRGRFLHPSVQIPYCEPMESAIQKYDARHGRWLAEHDRKKAMPWWRRIFT